MEQRVHSGLEVAQSSLILKYKGMVGTVRASLIAQLLKNPLAMQETPVQFLGGEDMVEKG